MIQDLRVNYGSIFESALLDEINEVAVFRKVPEGTDLIRPGEYVRSMPLLLSGIIKILRPDDEGRELLLYHLEKGDTCAMTLTCCLGNTKSEIHAVTETTSEILMIPIEKMEEWSARFRSWRNFVFNSYHRRLMELLDSIDNVAFSSLDIRLEKYLQDKVKLQGRQLISVTHQEIANDLHSSRVVVSRLLKKMENQNKIKLHRSEIEVLAS